MMNRSFMARLIPACALAAMAILTAACSDDESDDFVGGASGDMGIVANLDVAGVSQKGPFVEGSAVTVQGIDCKTMKFTDEVFEGEVKNNMGEFVVEKVNLSTTCAVVAVTGEYRSEMTGKKVSDKLTLRALTNLKDRTHVNVNLLTNLEYERVMHYVAEKGKTFDEAKDLAETEVLAAFGMAGDTTEFEDLDIFGTSDADATLLAISVLMQGDADVKTLAERMEKFSESFAASGKWNDDDTKKAIIDWIANAVAKAVMDSIRKNMENWGFANEVPDFETAVDAFATNVSKEESNDSVKTEGWSWDVPKDARLNPNIKYDSIIDPRDKQVYKVVKIDVPDANYSQVWMAENLNYADSAKTPSLKGGNWCYNDDEKNCKVSGRYYSWAAAIDSVALANDAEAPLDCGYGKKCGLDRAVQGICPDGWHLPSIYEWGLLSVALGNAPVSGEPLKALTGWNYAGTPDNNGTDLYGFAALPTGRISATKWEKVGSDVYYWSATEYSANDGRYFNINNVYTNSYTYQNSKSYGQSVRCVKGDPSTAPVRPSSSSSVDETKSSSSVTSVSSSSVPEGYVDPSTVVTGTMTDSRDGQTYKTVKIGNQVWMAENLNYAYTGVLYNNSGYTSDSTSWCFSNDPANCIKYGRLYTWAAAMDSVGTWSTNGKDCGYGVQCTPIYPVRGICPEGWHLPDKAEWNTLFTAVGGASTAGKMLSSTISWSSVPGGWVRDGYGTDAYSFSALPAGLRDATGYNNVGYHAYFWSSSEYNSSRTYIVGLDDEFDKADLYGSGKDYGYSVRCVKD